MHIKERVPRVLAAVAGTARAMRRHKRRTLAAGVALLLVTPLLTGSGVDAPAVHERKEQEAGDTSGTAIESRKENTMTTAVMNYETMVVGERPRRSLEELVDRVMDALFASNHEQPQETVARRVHDTRHLRKAGDLDGALAVFASVEPDTTAPNEVRWAYAEWLSLVRRTYRDYNLLVYSQGTGRAATLALHGDGTVEVLAVLGALRLPYGLITRS